MNVTGGLNTYGTNKGNGTDEGNVILGNWLSTAYVTIKGTKFAKVQRDNDIIYMVEDNSMTYLNKEITIDNVPIQQCMKSYKERLIKELET